MLTLDITNEKYTMSGIICSCISIGIRINISTIKTCDDNACLHQWCYNRVRYVIARDLPRSRNVWYICIEEKYYLHIKHRNIEKRSKNAARLFVSLKSRLNRSTTRALDVQRCSRKHIISILKMLFFQNDYSPLDFYFTFSICLSPYLYH